ncbi:hypothetical protein [Candidatus Albibeggiatoa sp. nov. BB20]|uniref:hypothetical protein n=1 Tax=Candidatus Albibeggiatoa sp. nov. BB20 TaxID=3162723 RepID=UPI0033654150
MALSKKLEPHEIEMQFLKTFILPKYYNRAYYELCPKNIKKRGDCGLNIDRDFNAALNLNAYGADTLQPT